MRSFLKPETATILPLGRIEDDVSTTCIHAEKATFLAERFFLSLNINLSDITDQSFERE